MWVIGVNFIGPSDMIGPASVTPSPVHHPRALEEFSDEQILGWYRASIDSVSVRAKREGVDRSPRNRPR